MKYIVTQTEDGTKEIFVFPKSVNHDTMAESISCIRSQSWGDWKRIYRTPVSAGFVKAGECCGRSETLNLNSDKEDTKLLLGNF